MTEKEAINAQLGTTIYTVVLSYGYYGSSNGGFKKEHHKPLGIFKTSINKIESFEEHSDWTILKAYIDPTPFRHLIPESYFYEDLEEQNISEFDIASMSSTLFCAMDDWGTKMPTPNLQFVDHMFYTEEEAKEYYDKSIKAFNKAKEKYYKDLKKQIASTKDKLKRLEKQLDAYDKQRNI